MITQRTKLLVGKKNTEIYEIRFRYIMQIKRILLIPFILLATVVLLPIIAILFGVGAPIVCLTEVFSSTYNWAFKNSILIKVGGMLNLKTLEGIANENCRIT